jgi:hypothetical protein
MRYLQINTGPWTTKPLPWWCKLLKLIIPAANPDLEKYYFQTRAWWLEVEDNGKPKREIGFDENRIPIVIGPLGRNFGFLTDSSDDWRDPKEDSAEVARDFQKIWESIWPKFKHLDKQDSQQGGGHVR